MVWQLKTIRENIEQIRKDIQIFSPFPEKVKILAVTKFQPIEKVKEALKEGIGYLGVNYAQEGKEIRETLKDETVHWHFIGHIQSRKAKYLTDYDCIESIDRLEVAQKINELAIKASRQLEILVEVNIGDELQKSGVRKEALKSFVIELKKLSHLKLMGLMAMPPALEPEQRRPFFRQLRNLFDQLSSEGPLEILSMGTSEDYRIALQEGATLIRLGTCLFGARPG